jgi:hypothetical protein
VGSRFSTTVAAYSFGAGLLSRGVVLNAVDLDDHPSLSASSIRKSMR